MKTQVDHGLQWRELPSVYSDNSNIVLHREGTDQLSHNALVNGGVSIFASLVGEMWHPWVVFYAFLLQVVERLKAGLFPRGLSRPAGWRQLAFWAIPPVWTLWHLLMTLPACALSGD